MLVYALTLALRWPMIGMLVVAIPVAAWFIWRADRGEGGDDLASASIEALQALRDDNR